MQISKKLFLVVLPVFFLMMFFGGSPVKASEHSAEGRGSVTVTDDGKSPIVDPEFPENEVDPGESPSTTGSLRIDFVSKLSFGSNQLTASERQFISQAQLFHSDTGPRGYYVQLTDRRQTANGWELQVSQNTQFKSTVIQNVEEQELNGATLSFDKGWANSPGDAEAPTVTRDTIAINEMNTAYTVATADDSQGAGIWTIEFGASAENQDNQTPTLEPLTDQADKPVMDTTFNKQAYSNSAIRLNIPQSTKIYPVHYSTTLTWILTAGPTK